MATVEVETRVEAGLKMPSGEVRWLKTDNHGRQSFTDVRGRFHTVVGADGNLDRVEGRIWEHEQQAVYLRALKAAGAPSTEAQLLPVLVTRTYTTTITEAEEVPYDERTRS